MTIDPIQNGESGASVRAKLNDAISAVNAGGLEGPPGPPGPPGQDGAPGSDGQDGAPGPAPELQTSATHIQWRPAGAETWNDLIALSALDGPPGQDGASGQDGQDGAPGPAIELQVSATHIQWRVVGAGSWTDLIALSALEGPPGTPGADGQDGQDGAPGSDANVTFANVSGVSGDWRGEGAETLGVAVADLQTALDARRVVVIHGATAGTARPAGAVYVEWVGSVAPTNATENDIWQDTSA